jgi:hypothetical protein
MYLETYILILWDERTEETLIDWLSIVLRPAQEFSLKYGNVTIFGVRLQNLGLSSALGVFEQGRIFVVPHLLLHGDWIFPVSSEGSPHLVTSYVTQGDMEDLF